MLQLAHWVGTPMCPRLGPRCAPDLAADLAPGVPPTWSPDLPPTWPPMRSRLGPKIDPGAPSRSSGLARDINMCKKISH